MEIATDTIYLLECKLGDLISGLKKGIKELDPEVSGEDTQIHKLEIIQKSLKDAYSDLNDYNQKY